MKEKIEKEMEKFKKSFKHVKCCMLLDRGGNAVACDIDDQEEMAFKLSVLFDVNNLEEMVIEKSNGNVCYLRRYNDKLIYIEFSKKPNIPLLNMYLSKVLPELFGKDKYEEKLAKPVEKPVIEKSKVLEVYSEFFREFAKYVASRALIPKDWLLVILKNTLDPRIKIDDNYVMTSNLNEEFLIEILKRNYLEICEKIKNKLKFAFSRETIDEAFETVIKKVSSKYGNVLEYGIKKC